MLIFAGQRFGWVKDLQANLSIVATPFYWVGDIPSKISEWSDENIRSRKTLIADNERFTAESLLLKAQVQKLASLEAENVRLRELLNSSAILDDSVLVAEMVGVSPDPLHHQIIVNKGKKDGLYVGQPNSLSHTSNTIAIYLDWQGVGGIGNKQYPALQRANLNNLPHQAQGIGYRLAHI